MVRLMMPRPSFLLLSRPSPKVWPAATPDAKRRRLISMIGAMIGLLSTIFFLSGAAGAGPETINIDKPWARATSPAAKAGGAFMMIHNHGREPDRLIGAHSTIAVRTGIHQTKMENGVMMMQPVDAIAIAPDEIITLKPGGYHIMFMGLKHPLTEGSSFPLTLVFEKAGKVTVSVPIKAAGAGMNMNGDNNQDRHEMPQMHMNQKSQ